MKLTVGERYVLLDVLPKEGTYTTLKIVRKLRENLSFSEEEIKAFGISETPSEAGLRVVWNVDRPQEADIDIGERATDVIATALKALDKSGKLTDREFSLFEKFVGE